MPIYERARQTCNSIMSSSDFFIKSIKYRSFFVQPCMYVFKKYLFEGNEFIPNILHEDNLFTIGLLLNKDVNVFCINDKIYQRRIRSNSIMTSAHSEKTPMDIFILLRIFITDIMTKLDHRVNLKRSVFLY